MATTTNYSWTTPDDTALVKDGASAIRTLGSSVDTTLKNLNPSTTLGDIEYRSSSANTNTRLGIGTTGQVLTVSGGVPAWTTLSGGGFEGCLLYKSSNQSLTNNTLTTITFDQEQYDTTAYHSTSVNNSRITVPTGKAGYYYLYALIAYTPSTGDNWAVQLELNGTTAITFDCVGSNGGNFDNSSGTSIVYYLNEGDYVQCRGRQIAGGTYDAKSGSVLQTRFGAVYLGA